MHNSTLKFVLLHMLRKGVEYMILLLANAKAKAKAKEEVFPVPFLAN